MHRQILKPKLGEIIDHINGVGLDNRRQNLRIVSYSVNALNKHNVNINNSSGVTGVSFRQGKWQALIRINGKLYHLGYFREKEEAMSIRQAAERKFLVAESRNEAPRKEIDKLRAEHQAKAKLAAEGGLVPRAFLGDPTFRELISTQDKNSDLANSSG